MSNVKKLKRARNGNHVSLYERVEKIEEILSKLPKKDVKFFAYCERSEIKIAANKKRFDKTMKGFRSSSKIERILKIREVLSGLSRKDLGLLDRFNEQEITIAAGVLNGNGLAILSKVYSLMYL